MHMGHDGVGATTGLYGSIGATRMGGLGVADRGVELGEAKDVGGGCQDG